MAKAKKLKSGSWRVRVFSHCEYIDGRKKSVYVSFTSDSKADAEMQAARFQTDKKRYSKGRVTVAEALKRYIESRKNVISPATYREYSRCYNNCLDIIGVILVSDVTSVDLQEYVSRLSATLSPKTVKNYYGLVLSAIRQYSEKIYRVKLPDRIPPEYHVPTDAEVRTLLDNANPRLKLAIALAAFGTLRRGEICALKYKDVLYDFRAIYVHADMVLNFKREWIYKDFPKTNSSIRRVELPLAVLDMIPPCDDPEAFIYSGTPTTIDHTFGKLRKKLGFSCRFHDLRHYAASSLHAAGIPDQYIMERGGWSTDATLKSVYRNTLSDKSKIFNQKAIEYYNDVLGKDEKKAQ